MTQMARSGNAQTLSGHLMPLLRACFLVLLILTPTLALQAQDTTSDVVVSEPIAPTRIGVELMPPDAAWANQNDVQPPTQIRLTHPELPGASIQLIVLDTHDFEDKKPIDLQAAEVVLSWDEQFRAAGPLTQIVEHDPERDAQGIRGVFGHIRYRDERVGLYFGFSSQALARKLGVELIHDRFAYFILIEGPATHEARLTQDFMQALALFECHL